MPVGQSTTQFKGARQQGSAFEVVEYNRVGGVAHLTRTNLEKEMDKPLLNVIVWVFFLGGMFGFIMALIKVFSGGSPAEYGVLGIGGGLWLLSSAITIYIQHRVS